MENVWAALGLIVFAGLATGIGSVIAFTARRMNDRFLSVATGFSAGVMLSGSFMEILPEASRSLGAACEGSTARWMAAAAFFGGIALIGIIDRLVPAAENPHEALPAEERAPWRP